MTGGALTPHITVTIGPQTGVDVALVTKAPSTLDTAGTVTLQAGMLGPLSPSRDTARLLGSWFAG